MTDLKGNYQFECRDKLINVPKDEFNFLFEYDWFLGNMMKDLDVENDDEIVKLYEDSNVVLSIIDSLRYRKIIIHPGVDFEYFRALSDKWCLPEFIMTKIDVTNDIKNMIKGKIKNLMLSECKNCGAAFDPNENTNKSCEYHPGEYVEENSKFDCCGSFHKCTKGYHKSKTENLKFSIQKIKEYVEIMNNLHYEKLSYCE